MLASGLMAVIHILSAGAAQSVAEQIAARLKSERGCEVEASFGAVGAMKARVGPARRSTSSSSRGDDRRAGRGGSRRAGFAHRSRQGRHRRRGARGHAGRRRFGHGGARAACWLRRKIVCPDPAIATAGKVSWRSWKSSESGRSRGRPSLSERLRRDALARRERRRARTRDHAGERDPAQQGGNLCRAAAGACQMKAIYSAGVAANAPIRRRAQDHRSADLRRARELMRRRRLRVRLRP